MRDTEKIWIAVIASLVVVVTLGILAWRTVETPTERPFDYGTRPFVPGKSHYAVEPIPEIELPRPESTRREGGER